jgi:hypothetical protein
MAGPDDVRFSPKSDVEDAAYLDRLQAKDSFVLD